MDAVRGAQTKYYEAYEYTVRSILCSATKKCTVSVSPITVGGRGVPAPSPPQEGVF
ncbi:MAG: hypothetical protein UV60_C0006G0063 [Parcubacteria group bacterium GW2011_GWA2_43_11]|nr:MAG: hypothetical protein UV60_C0006G0063 [Parcubacteria group bacterium GW2011_GWA2_43_11]